MKTQEKGQFIIILYRAYLLDFQKLYMRITPLSKLNTMMESASRSSKPLGNDSLPKMAQFTMKTRKKGQFIVVLYRAYLLDFLLDFLKLNMKIIQLSKPNSMI